MNKSKIHSRMRGIIVIGITFMSRNPGSSEKDMYCQADDKIFWA